MTARRRCCTRHSLRHCLRLGITGLLAALLTLLLVGPPNSVAARETPTLVDFASDEGNARLARASAKVDFAALANQFEAQSNNLFCGPTSAAIVLNALHGRSQHLPRDRHRQRAGDDAHLPPGTDLALPRFTADTVIEKGAKTRAQVFGQPMSIQGKTINDYGYQLRQLDEMLRANGAESRMTIVDDSQTDNAIRKTLIDNLERAGNYVIVNYLRRKVGQSGGGHISPLAAYDAVSDSFLVLDVNPAAASWVWMLTATLIDGMRSFDTTENRGFLLIGPQ